MESQSAAKSMLASFLTFQFLCSNRSSQANFFASFNNFSSSDIFFTVYLYHQIDLSKMQVLISPPILSLQKINLRRVPARDEIKERKRERKREMNNERQPGVFNFFNREERERASLFGFFFFFRRGGQRWYFRRYVLSKC